MKTTLVLPDRLMRRLKTRAARDGRTLSSLAADLLATGLSRIEKPDPKELPPLPVFDMGEMLVDVSDRDALYAAMERHDRVRR
jgi:plasmid stability protein